MACSTGESRGKVRVAVGGAAGGEQGGGAAWGESGGCNGGQGLRRITGLKRGDGLVERHEGEEGERTVCIEDVEGGCEIPLPYTIV